MKVTAKLRPHLISVPTSDAGLIAAARRLSFTTKYVLPSSARKRRSRVFRSRCFPCASQCDFLGSKIRLKSLISPAHPDTRPHNPKRTLVEHIGMSALCQKQTKCVAAKSLYWITSSAATRKVCGTVRPSSLAVLRLMVSKYFTGICTGSPDGFAPRRILST